MLLLFITHWMFTIFAWVAFPRPPVLKYDFSHVSQFWRDRFVRLGCCSHHSNIVNLMRESRVSICRSYTYVLNRCEFFYQPSCTMCALRKQNSCDGIFTAMDCKKVMAHFRRACYLSRPLYILLCMCLYLSFVSLILRCRGHPL